MNGEYTGTDGKRYRWVKGRKEWLIEEWSVASIYGETEPGWHPGRLYHADVDIAFAALKELQEEGEWVEIDPQHRVRRDGTEPQIKRIHKWETNFSTWSDAYRAGRTTGLEDRRKEAEELAEAMLAMARSSVFINTQTIRTVDEQLFQNALDLARKVEK